MLRDLAVTCPYCGEPIESDATRPPTIGMAAASGHASEWVIKIDGQEVHRCLMNERDRVPA